MSEFDRLKAQKDAILRSDCGEDRFALAVRVLARLREAGLIAIEGKTDEEWRDNLHKAQILTMQVINATSPGPRIGRSEVGQSPRASTATEGVDRVADKSHNRMP